MSVCVYVYVFLLLCLSAGGRAFPSMELVLGRILDLNSGYTEVKTKVWHLLTL